MQTVIYTGGVNPFGDGTEPADTAIARFAEKVRARNPGITDRGVSQVVKQALDLMRPRMHNRIVSLLGRDILTDDLEGAWFWPLVGDSTQRLILAHPLHGGAMITSDMTADQRKALMHTAVRAQVNRSAIVMRHDDRELSRTYVFSRATRWEQEMDDQDVNILLSYRQLRQMFVFGDIGRAWQPIRAYSHIPVRETHNANTVGEATRIVQDMRRTHHYTGVDVRKDS